MSSVLYKNALIYSSSQKERLSDHDDQLRLHSFLVREGRIQSIFEELDQERNGSTGGKVNGHSNGHTTLVDLQGKLVLPTFVDAHCHIMHFGKAMGYLDLYGCKSLQHIRSRISTLLEQNPDTPRIICSSWIPDMMSPGEIDRRFFDDFGKPIYIIAFDLHSSIINTKAMEEVGVAEEMSDPAGGTFVRDSNSRMTGWMQEMAHLGIVEKSLNGLTAHKDKVACVERAFQHLLAAGYTGAADLATDPESLRLFDEQLQRDGSLPLRLRVYWLIAPSDSLEGPMNEVKKAAELRDKYAGNEWLQVNGIKLVSDGVIDACTAAMMSPYANGTNAEPMWSLNHLSQLVQLAHSLDLQCATHAIGELAVHYAVEAYATLGREQVMSKRHRIEHLEVTTEADAKRLGRLGITASCQPVHSDPEILNNWFEQLGGKQGQSYPATHRCSRAFAYRQFIDEGAPFAIGTDAPTAPHPPLPNLHVATTRSSAMNKTNPYRTTPKFALQMTEAVVAATYGAARACHLDADQGTLEVGKLADFNVLDTHILEPHAQDQDKDLLLQTKVIATYRAGELVACNGQVLKEHASRGTCKT